MQQRFAAKRRVCAGMLAQMHLFRAFLRTLFGDSLSVRLYIEKYIHSQKQQFLF